MAKDNLQFWKDVSTPDPKYTKNFNRGGGFKGTATNTQYQVMKATEMFGMNGAGWGYEITKEEYVTGGPLRAGGNVIVHVVRGFVWYIDPGSGERLQTSEQYGQTTFVGENKNGVFTDEEAPKKSTTDMLLKCLSLLGFSADIFLGLWDDNKYVAEIKQQYAQSCKSRPETISEEQEITLRELLFTSDQYTVQMFLAEAKIKKLSDLLKTKYKGALDYITRRVEECSS